MAAGSRNPGSFRISYFPHEYNTPASCRPGCSSCLSQFLLLYLGQRSGGQAPAGEMAMEYRDWTKKDGIGRDISTSLLGYGNTARAAGVNYFDTAFPYHGGESEPFVGRVIAKWPRESFYLATKLPLWSCKTLDEAKDIFEKQFERLGVAAFPAQSPLRRGQRDGHRRLALGAEGCRAHPEFWLLLPRQRGGLRTYPARPAVGLLPAAVQLPRHRRPCRGDRRRPGLCPYRRTECSPHHHGAHQGRYR